MRVNMLEDRKVTVDGVNTVDCVAGETYEMGAGVANSLVDQGAAAYTNGEPEPELEDKDAGAAEETKPAGDPAEAKPARGRSKKSAVEPEETV